MKNCKNGRLLIITNDSRVGVDIDNDLVPSVVLLTAWNSGRADVCFWGKTVSSLLRRGASYFACVGGFAEKLHDEIDELIYQYYADSNRELNVITTYHDDDSLEEVVNYCVYGTELEYDDGGYVLAILDESSEEDNNLRRLLELA